MQDMTISEAKKHILDLDDKAEESARALINAVTSIAEKRNQVIEKIAEEQSENDKEKFLKLITNYVINYSCLIDDTNGEVAQIKASDSLITAFTSKGTDTITFTQIIKTGKNFEE